MRVLKRNGTMEDVSFDKVLTRIAHLSKGLCIDPSVLAQQVCGRIYDKIATAELDEFASSLSASMSLENLDFEILASRIIISNLHKNTSDDYAQVVLEMKDFLDPLFVSFVQSNSDRINGMLKYERDYLFDYFGFKTLEKGKYIFRNNAENKPVERPQHMMMRVAIGIHMNEICSPDVFQSIQETYDLLSQKMYTHATPTLFNAGTKRPQLSSCFLLDMQQDSIDGIYDTLKDCALISKEAGGIGLAVHKIRAKNSRICGTNGHSNGLVPMLKVFNETAKYVDQCLLPNTLIYTSEGPVEIQYCTSHETTVYNVDGSAEAIENVLEFVFSGDVYHIASPYSGHAIQVTCEHLVYCIKKNSFQGFEGMQKKQRLDLPSCWPLTSDMETQSVLYTYTEARNVSVGDFLVYKVPVASQDLTCISEQDCYMYGCLLAAGDINNSDVDDAFQGYIDIPKSNRVMKESIQQYFANKCIFCVECDYSAEMTRFMWHRSTIMPFKHGDIYNTRGVRHVHKKWLNLPKRKCKYILRGILHACSHVGYVESDDLVLIKAIQFLCLKVRVVCCTEVGASKNRAVFQPDKRLFKMIGDPQLAGTWRTLHGERQEPCAMFLDKYTLVTPVTKVDRTMHRGIVYDLQMTDVHNYMTCDGGIVHNGGGKRKGSFSIYLEPWHADIQDFLELKKSRGSEELRARDLFYALWIPDLFMKRVREDKLWTLFCPSICPGLSEKWGVEFEKQYTYYEKMHPECRRVSAQELWRQILTSCVETGGPSILFKDACNAKSNHQHLGTIQSSNLCTEIIQYSAPDETAVCNLASICLPSFVAQKSFDYAKLRMVVRKIVANLNRVIDTNFYPTEKCRRSNQRHRPIGIGVQGMADMFHLMELSWEDPQAMCTNKNIFEVIYYSALEMSCELAKLCGHYESYPGSPLSQGKLQFHFWPDVKPSGVDGLCNWDELLPKIAQYGCRNSLLVAPMPTASTSQIMGYSECFEPYTSNIFVRRTNAGEFKMLNRHLIKKLMSIGLWNKEVRNKIMLHDGSVQWMDDSLHADVKKMKQLYKTVWEIKHRLMVDFACERGAFIDQSQSFNVYMEDPSINKLNGAYFYSWTKGIKTCQYYLRIRTKAKAIPITVDQETASVNMRPASESMQRMEEEVCSRDNPDCTTCSA